MVGARFAHIFYKNGGIAHSFEDDFRDFLTIPVLNREYL